VVSSLFLFASFALSNNKLHSFLNFGQVCFCFWQQSSTVGFCGSGLILLFGLLVWFSSFVVAEPPCGEWVSWFVTDKPMLISFDQLEQLKNILFNHLDHSCRRNSIQYGHSVARPIQETANRPVYLCTEADFGPDP
jgi:hypothetical protein